MGGSIGGMFGGGGLVSSFAGGDTGSGLMGILGPEGAGLTGSTSQSTQTTELDPTTQALNQFRLQMLQQGPGAQYLFGAHPEVYSLSPQSQGLFDRAQAVGTQQSVNPLQWYNNTWSMLNPTNEQGRLGELSGQNRAALEGTLQNYLGYGQGNLQGTLSNQLGYGQGINENVLNQQLGYINNMMSPQLMGAGNQYYNQIMGPQLGNQYSLMGLGRSGGRQEAEARGAASIALPLQQTLAGLQGQSLGQYGGNQANLVNQAYGQYGAGQQNLINSAYGQYGAGLNQNLMQNYTAQAGLGGQALQNLYGLNQAYPGVALNTAQSDLSRLMSLYGGSQVPQLWGQQGLQSQQGLYSSFLNSTPYTPASTINKTGTGNEGILDSAFGAAVGGGVGSAAGKVLSDRRVKKNIQTTSLKDFLDTLTPYSFEYRDSKHGEGTRVGIMAQDLEKTEIGKSFVFNTLDGKAVDYQSMASLLLSCVIDLHKRLKELEDAR